MRYFTDYHESVIGYVLTVPRDACIKGAIEPLESDMTNAQIKIMEAYKATGRCAFYYPRKKAISLNGGKLLSVKEAVEKMTELLKRA